MSPQDHELILAKVDVKMADLRGGVLLNTQGLGELKERFGDLATKMATVPADLAAMKRDIAHLPSKSFIVWSTVTALSLIAAVSAFIQWVLAARIGQ